MVNYGKGIIYKLCCNDPEITDMYVGSTCNFKVRKHGHKKKCNSENQKGYNSHVYKFIRDNGGWDNWSMVLIKKYPNVIDNHELLKKERKWLKKLKGSLNKNIPSRTKQEYYEDNKDIIIERKRQYNEKNKDMIRKQKQQYRKHNKEQIKAYKNEKIECECGCLISRNHLSRHRTTKKHIELINDK